MIIDFISLIKSICNNAKKKTLPSKVDCHGKCNDISNGENPHDKALENGMNDACWSFQNVKV